MTQHQFQQRDSIGIPKFQVQQAKAWVELVKRTGKLKSDPPPCSGQGIVIAGGGRYLSHAWVCCKIIRQTGCTLPIRVYHMGRKEMPAPALKWFADLGAECVDVIPAAQKMGVNGVSGWTSKNIAIADCPWEMVLFLDADCYPSRNPEELMDDPELQNSGALLFSDVARHAKNSWAWIYSGLLPWEKEGELGQYIVNKRIGWMGLRWAIWYGEHADVWGKMVHGDKDWTLIGFRVSEVPFLFSTESEWAGHGIRQSWKGKDWFNHQMGAKRGEHPWTPDVQKAFWEWSALSLGKI